MKCNSLFATALALVSLGAFAALEPASPESQGVDSRGILNWIDACEKTFDGGPQGRLHGFVILRHGRTVAEGSWRPFDTLNETHMLYSHSKSFTSSAVGLLVDAGKLDLDERIIDIFSNDVPAVVSEDLRQLRVRDLLTMNVGCDADHRVGRFTNGWVRAFLAKPIGRRPGTGFRYDSDATYMLAALVEQRSGEKLMDFLRTRLFDRIGIEKAWTTCSPEGIACGGWGMNMTTRELARFGQLYLQNGMWDGEYVLSPFWCQLATARHTWSGWRNVGMRTIGEGSDWEQGYGFQFWRCTHGAYRADGAYGQYTIVMPEQDMVVSIHAGVGDMQKELTLVWKHLLPAVSRDPLPESAATKALKERLANLAIPPCADAGDAAFALGKTFTLKENRRGFVSVRFDPDAEGFVATVVTPAGEQKVPVGRGVWRKGTMRIDTRAYEALGGYIGVHATGASGGVDAEGTFRVRVYLTGDTGHLDFAVTPEGRLTGDFWAMGGCRLSD